MSPSLNPGNERSTEMRRDVKSYRIQHPLFMRSDFYEKLYLPPRDENNLSGHEGGRNIFRVPIVNPNVSAFNPQRHRRLRVEAHGGMFGFKANKALTGALESSGRKTERSRVAVPRRIRRSYRSDRLF